MELTKKAPDWSGMGWGVGIVGAGILGMIAIQAFDIVLRIKRIELPPWLLMLVCGAVVLGGAATMWMFARSNMCVACKKHLDSGSAYFPLELEREVTEAARTLEARSLENAPMVPKAQSKMAIDLHFCPNCKNVGILDVVKWNGTSPEWLFDQRAISGEGVARLATITESHERWRDSQEATEA